MESDQAAGGRAAECLSRLVQARQTIERAQNAEARARRDLSLLGFNGRAVDLAMLALDQGIRSTVHDHQAAQKLLRMLRAPVQIELAEYYETPDALTEGRRVSIAYDEGWWASMSGASRVCKAPCEATRAAWKRGYDDARTARVDVISDE
jgi:hypothetical protein